MTTWMERFKSALALLCRKPVPDGMAEAWIAQESETLQNWVACNTPMRWAQGIVVVEAAEAIADQPEEGYDHHPREPAPPLDGRLPDFKHAIKPA